MILFILCLSIPLAFRYQWLLAEKYAALPYLLSDMVRGDTFPDPDQRLSLAERIYLPHNGSDIFMSVLTTHKYHDKRLSRLFVTWMQTVDPKQVSQLPGQIFFNFFLLRVETQRGRGHGLKLTVDGERGGCDSPGALDELVPTLVGVRWGHGGIRAKTTWLNQLCVPHTSIH